MRFINVFILLAIIIFNTNAYASNQEANVNVVLEIEGEYKFVPFKKESLGLAGLIENGVLRVIKESDTGLNKYAALNEAMQNARREVWKVIQDSLITDTMTVGQAVKAAPMYFEYKEKDEEDKAKLDAMTDAERKAFIEEHGKEKKYDYDKFLSIVHECGEFKNSGRFYDAVEQKGYACLEVKKNDFFDAIQNDKINIFKELEYGDRYRPVDGVRRYNYGGIIVDSSEIDYIPSLFVKVLSPTEETVYSGVAGKKDIFFADNISDAKRILGSKGVKRVYDAKSTSTTGTGLIVDLKSSDRILSAISKDKNIPFVIIYKKIIEQPMGESVEETVPTGGE
ncbi:MAG: hypothetical protein C0603_03145 [Denitrovibrio sp.]|nr:MAG: hypothetical protein C0603_03145 [Denitrovibrio sp.]